MCDEIGVFTDKEVKNLDAKGRKALRDEALRHFQSPAVKKLVKKDPIAQIIHPHKDVRKTLRDKLRPKLNELKKASGKK
jgi:hypothetical protein